MEEFRWGEKEVKVKRMTDEIKNKCQVGIRGFFTQQLIYMHIYTFDKWTNLCT